MTLLEVLVAIVVLGMSAGGLLGGLQGASRSLHDARQWHRAVALAEAGLADPHPSAVRLPDGFSRITEVRPGGATVSEVIVTVRFPDARSFVVRRLQRTDRRSDP